MDVGAKYFSPVRAPMMSGHPTIKHRHAMNRGARPNVTTHRMCRGEIFFARARAVDAQSPTHCGGARATRRRNTDVGGKYFSPARARLMRNRPHIVVARPPHATAPRMYGRNIFRPYVCQRYPFAQPSNIATP